MTEKKEERRRFFRINDKIGINYKVIDQSIARRKRAHTGDLRSLIAIQDERIDHLLLAVARKDPQTAEVIKLLNKKIGLLANYLEIERSRVDDMAYIVKNVNISACGLAFMAEEPVEKGDLLEIELLLTGEAAPLIIEGIVVSCDKKSSTKYYLRIDFDSIDTADQETLIQYMVKRQSEFLREMLTKNKSQQSTGY